MFGKVTDECHAMCSSSTSSGVSASGESVEKRSSHWLVIEPEGLIRSGVSHRGPEMPWGFFCTWVFPIGDWHIVTFFSVIDLHIFAGFADLWQADNWNQFRKPSVYVTTNSIEFKDYDNSTSIRTLVLKKLSSTWLSTNRSPWFPCRLHRNHNTYGSASSTLSPV